MLEAYEWQRDDMQLPLTWFSHNCHCMPHFHAGIELVYVCKGSFSGIINGKAVEIRENQMLVNSCYAVHAYDNSRLEAIITVIPMNAVPTLKKKLTASRFSANVITDDEDLTLSKFMLMMKTFSENKYMQCGLSEALLGYLIERVGLESVDASDHSNLLCRILMYLNENFKEPLTVETLSEYFGYSRSRFSHLFKANLGYSLPRYLNTLRIRHAAELLLRTDMTVTQIALESGFNNTHTFYTAFRSVFGQTPAEYLRMQNTAVTAREQGLTQEAFERLHEKQTGFSENHTWMVQNSDMERCSALNLCDFPCACPPPKDL
ncbi:MAG: AraC family transcriptional regulator [Clostridia bacterium]|nr:AraC family transcriptional regulator [Clostridia bacterium]